MPVLNDQPIFRSNAIKHYMQGREKHEFPRFVSLPTTIFLWVLLVLFVSATMLVWSEQVPTYATAQGIVVVQPATQSAVQPATQSAVETATQPVVETVTQSVVQTETQSADQPTVRPTAQFPSKSAPATKKSAWTIRRSASAAQRPTPATEASASETERLIPRMEESAAATQKQMSGMEKSVSEAQRQISRMQKSVLEAQRPMSSMQKSVSIAEKSRIPATVMVVLFFPPAQAQNLYAGMGIGLNINASGQHINSQITKIVPGVMKPAALRSLYHLENTPLSITQPSTVVVAKLDEALATTYAGSQVTATLQVGSQRLISFLPGIGGLFGN